MFVVWVTVKMRRKHIIIGLSIAILFVSFEVYVLNNKYSLSINLGDCDYPESLTDIQITHRFNLISFFSSLEGHSSAKCKIDKRDLRAWLLNSDFEVLSFIEPLSEERKFIVDKNKIPTGILQGEMEFSFQFLHSNDQRTVVTFQLLQGNDRMQVNLEYCES